MCPFPPEDELEIIEAHATIDLLIFGNLAIFVEFLLPFGSVQGRNHAVDRLPFGNGEARAGQPCSAAEDDQRDQLEEYDIEPAAHQAPVPRNAHRNRGSLCQCHPLLSMNLRRLTRLSSVSVAVRAAIGCNTQGVRLRPLAARACRSRRFSLHGIGSGIGMPFSESPPGSTGLS